MKKATCKVCGGRFAATPDEIRRKSWTCAGCLASEIDTRRDASGKKRLSTKWFPEIGAKKIKRVKRTAKRAGR
jgi:hypothetical protein